MTIHGVGARNTAAQNAHCGGKLPIVSKHNGKQLAAAGIPKPGMTA